MNELLIKISNPSLLVINFNSLFKIPFTFIHINKVLFFIIILLATPFTFAQNEFDWSVWKLYESVVDEHNKVIVKIEYQTRLTKAGNARAKWRVHNLSGLSASYLRLNSKLYNLSDGRKKWTSSEAKSRNKAPFAHGDIVTFTYDSASNQNNAKITKVTLKHPSFSGEFINNKGEKIKLSSDDFGVMHRSLLTCKSDNNSKKMAITLERLGDVGFKVVSEENNRSFTFLTQTYLDNPTSEEIKTEYNNKFRDHIKHLCDGKVANGWLKELTGELYRIMTECSNHKSLQCNGLRKKSTSSGVRG